MKILITENIAEEGIAYLIEQGQDVTVNYTLNRDALLEIIGDYDALIVRSVTKVNEELYSCAKNLKVVGRAGNGIDNIEMDGATKRGIIIVNTPDANTVSAAEHTIALLLSMSRHIPRANAHIKAKNWDRTLFRGVELKGKTLGIIGLGRIGSMVATRMKAFEMNVVAFDPYVRLDKFEKLGVDHAPTLNDLLCISDFISVHTPKTKETIGLINAESFKSAKKGLRVVNCARGGIIDETALYDAIVNGTVVGAGIDVLKDEPHPISPLLDLDETVITPHLGADTVEAQINVGKTVAIEVFEALKGKLVSNAVNLPALSEGELEQLRPYLKLSENLGKIYHQLYKNPVTKIELIYKGEFAEKDTSTLALGFIKGIFDGVLDDKVNYVNARFIAESRGILILEGKERHSGNYSNSIQAKVHSESGIFTVEGALFGKEEIRIVELNGYIFDVLPKGPMLLIENLDQPGMIGKIGVTLGKENINISTMNVSVTEDKPTAMMFLTIDYPVSERSLESIRTTEGIKDIWSLVI